MPTPRDIEALLVRQQEAADELRAATREAHAAIRDLKHATRDAEKTLPGVLESLLGRHLTEAEERAWDEMRVRLSQAVDRIEVELRERLGL